MEKIFRNYCRITNQVKKYGKLYTCNGQKYVRLFNGQVIKHLAFNGKYYTIDNSIYRIVKMTCNNRCKVGKPLKHCIENGNYDENQCATVFLYKVDLNVEFFPIKMSELKKYDIF